MKCRNVLLIFIPIGMACLQLLIQEIVLIIRALGWALYFAKHSGHVQKISDTAVFVTTFIAIIPLGAYLSDNGTSS